MKRLVIALLALLGLLLATPSLALAGPSETKAAKKHLDAATAAHAKGQFETALKELETAYQIDPQPDVLFAIGQVYVKLDDCASAIAYYELFLESNPPDDAAAPTREAIAACQARLPPPEPKTTPVVPPPPPPSPPAPFYTDVLGGALIGAGLLSGVAGIFVYASARGTLDDAGAATSYDAHARLVDDAHRKRTYSVALGAVGALLVGAGVYRYASVRERDRTATAQLAPTRGGAILTWSGRF